jgi:hypothetical protein
LGWGMRGSLLTTAGRGLEAVGECGTRIPILSRSR